MSFLVNNWLMIRNFWKLYNLKCHSESKTQNQLKNLFCTKEVKTTSVSEVRRVYARIRDFWVFYMKNIDSTTLMLIQTSNKIIFITKMTILPLIFVWTVVIMMKAISKDDFDSPKGAYFQENDIFIKHISWKTKFKKTFSLHKNEIHSRL